jgi:acetolactate synthase I/II/III large subunit
MSEQGTPASTDQSQQSTKSSVSKFRAADVVVRTLDALGVRTFYGIPGGSISPIYDALLDMPNAKTIVSRHESAAVFAAIGHARASDELPCVLVTSGPGLTNALTAIASAYCDSVPVLVISGEVPRKHFGRGAVQEGSRYGVDIISMARSTTKLALEITNPRSAAMAVRKAVATAKSGRKGPVLLTLPLDIACEMTDLPEISSAVHSSFDIDEHAVMDAAKTLSAAERPLLLVGSGARNERTANLIGILAAALQIPVVTTPKGKGIFPETDPLSLGVFGLAGHPSATEYLEQGVDVIMAIGCGFGDTATNSWSPLLQPKKCLIQIDVDGSQIGKNYPVDIGIVGPAEEVLHRMLPLVKRRLAIARAQGLRHQNPEWKADGSMPLKPAHVISLLQGVLPDDTIYTCDIGEHQMFALHYLTLRHPDAWILNSGLGAMGSGMASAVGAKVARPEQPVVAICGDYSFAMYAMELQTCVQYGIPTVFAVFNDASPRMVSNGFAAVYGRSMDLQTKASDLWRMATSLGAHAVRVESVTDFPAIASAVERAQHERRPLVLDIRVDPKVSFKGNARNAHIRQFASSVN